MTSIDKFIEEKVATQYRGIVTEFRMLIKNDYPALKEEMRGGTEKYFGVPVYIQKRTVITVSPSAKGITFNFAEGKKLEDKYNKLEGVGNKTLNLRIRTIDEFKPEEFKYYIDQALRLDSER